MLSYLEQKSPDVENLTGLESGDDFDLFLVGAFAFGNDGLLRVHRQSDPTEECLFLPGPFLHKLVFQILALSFVPGMAKGIAETLNQ